MSEPSQIFEALIYASRVRHNGNPVLRNHVQNSSVKHSKDNRMIIPYKSHQKKRIDGVTGTVMALNRAMIGEPSVSMWETRGISYVEGA
jgi:phage terminase large subunit-like protein